MKNVLFVDDEKSFMASLFAGFETCRRDYQVHSAQNGKAAIKILETIPVDLVVTDLKMPEMDGFELLAFMSSNFPSIPAIVLSAYGTPEIRKRFEAMGALRFLDKPIDFEALTQAVTDALSQNYDGGYVSSISIGSFLQFIKMEQKTCLLRVSKDGNGREGLFYFNKGDLFDAVCGKLEAEDAALEMIAWGSARIKINGLPKKEIDKRIHTELIVLIMEAMKKKDESAGEGENDPHKPDDKIRQGTGKEDEDDLLAQATRFALGHHFKQSQKVLLKILSINPRNFRAWLWLSRISVDIETIARCLYSAKKIAPTDPFVIRENARFDLVRRKKTEGGKFRHCPFCWFLFESGSTTCPSCNTFLSINRFNLSNPKFANRKILEEAIERYKNMVGREKNNFICFYYLSLCHLNLEHWEEGINCLSKAVDLSPKNAFLLKQLNYVLQYLASVSKQKGAIEPSKSRPVTKKDTILVVEDSPTTRKVISITLRQKGYRIIEAGDGLEALSRLNQEIPDLILLDIILPKMDGYQILDIIKKKPELKSIPVVMLTAKDRFVDKLKGKMAGSSKYLTKPFEPDQLVEVVNKYLK